ncbi:MAG TPA: DUF1015 domain-containing protein [Actinomycetes bacterium]
MVVAAPFRGLRFDPDVVGDPGAVTAPPYDVISPAARDAYEAQSPYNMVRLILARGEGRGPGRYRPVAELMSAWHDQGALVLDPLPALYLYEEAYELRGQSRVQRGVLASVALDDTATSVLPHERTMAGPVSDRLDLLQATRANLSPVFGVYAGGGRTAAVVDDLTATPPAVDCVDDAGVRHRLWPVTDQERIAAWCGLLADRRVLIADGHHRYRTSLAYRDAMRAAGPGPWDEVLMFLVDADLHGPSIQPIHRLLVGLTAHAMLDAVAEDFEARPAGSLAELEAALAGLPAEVTGFGLVGGGGSWLLVAGDQAALEAEVGTGRHPLDAEVLHGPVLAKRLGVTDFEGQVRYENDLAEAVAQLERGAAASMVVLRPTPFEQVVAVAQNGGTLPQKTTYFYPKPRDGLVIRPLDPEAFAQ